MSQLAQFTAKILDGEYLERGEALHLVQADLYELFLSANRIRKHFKGDEVSFCSIINARSGSCSQDCKFCAQSAHYSTGVKTYPLVSPQQVGQGAEAAIQARASHYGVVISGRGLGTEEETEQICRLLRAVPSERLSACASLGELTPDFAARLRETGLTRYHHNLETSARFFPQVCSTHSYEDRVRTLQVAKDAGFELCSGGIFGLGEDWEDRIDLALALRKLGVNSVPLNFLLPVPGTPLEHNPPLPPLEILRIIAVFRLILPDRNIKVAGGREPNLRNLQSWIFFAGANGALIGNYLTTAGRPPEEDLQMIADLELTAS